MSTHLDLHAYPLTTTSPEAAAAYRDAARRLLTDQPGAADALRSAIDHDPAFALAHAALAASLTDTDPDQSRAHLDAARVHAPHTTRRERQHVELLAAIGAGGTPQVAPLAAEHLAEFPRDTLILRQVARTVLDTGDRDQHRTLARLLHTTAPHLDSEGWALAVAAAALDDQLPPVAPPEPRTTQRASRLRMWIAIAAPVLTGLVVATHPWDPTHAMDLAEGGPGHWIAIHVGLLAALPLLAIAVWTMADRVRGHASVVARAALAPALALYAAFESLVGLGTGVLVRELTALPADQHEAAATLVEAWWAVPHPIGLIAGAAQLSWVVALGALAVAYTRAGYPRSVTVSLATATVLFPLLHVQPFGIVSMAALATAAVLTHRCRPAAQGSDPTCP